MIFFLMVKPAVVLFLFYLNLHINMINNCVFTSASGLWQNNARSLRVRYIKWTNPKSKSIGQASKLKRNRIFFGHNSRAQNKDAVISLIHT